MAMRFPRSMMRTPPLRQKDHLDYSKGYNSHLANDVMPDNQLVYATDTRISTLGRQKTRRGLDFYTVPAGETQVDSQTSVLGAADQSLSTNTWLAARIVPGSTGRLTKVELNLKNVTAATGEIMVAIYADNAGTPGTLLAQSSIPASSPTTTYNYYTARFIAAPQVTNLTVYWLVAYIQGGGTNSYAWSSTTAATTSRISTNAGVSYSSTSFALNYRVHVSTDSPVLGMYRAYKSDGSKKTLMAHGTSLYTVNDNTGALTAIKTGLAGTASRYSFAATEDVIYYVNGIDAPRKWDFTTEAATATSPGISSEVVLHKNRLFYVNTSDPTRIFFSGAGAGNFETFSATDFLYVPSPKSPDPIVKMVSFNDNLLIFTSRTKWVLSGSDISSMVLRQATGVKGTIAPSSVQVTRSHVYFASDDGFYRFNGGTDELLSEAITDEYLAAANRTSMGSGLTASRYYLSFTPPGGSVNSQTWVYNINYGSIESRDLNTYVQRTMVWNGTADTGQFIQASNVVGALYYAELSSNNYSNLGAPLTWEIRTKYDHFGQPSSDKQVKRWYPRFAAAAGNYTVECQADKDFANAPAINYVYLRGNGGVWGAGSVWGGGTTWGASALVSPRLTVPGRQPYTQIRYKRAGVNMPVEFYGDTLFYNIRIAR